MSALVCQSIVATAVILSLVVVHFAGSVPASLRHRKDVSSWQETPIDWQTVGQQALQRALSSGSNNNVAKNVILFIGDGMGITTVTAARIYASQKEGRPGEEGKLSFEDFPHVALSKTYNVNHQVADSAGTATAFLTGIKTRYGVIGVNENVRRKVCSDMKNNSVDSILRWSLDEGKRTGVVTTTRITHATPASSYAHSPDRDWEDDCCVPVGDRYEPLCHDIADQLVTNNNDINVILGGGRRHFLPANSSSSAGTRCDGRSLVQEWQDTMKARGNVAAYVSTKNDFDAVNPDTTDYLFGLFSESHMQFHAEWLRLNPNEPTLADMTEKAIKILRRDPDGYFLLVEGGRIDHAHHNGVAKVALEEVISFSEAIDRAVKMTDLTDTLIVVTADHSHVMTMGGYPSRGNPILGFVDEIGFNEEKSLDGMPYLTLSYANGPGILGRTNLTGVDSEGDVFQQPVNVPLESETHGGEDVAIYAVGPMSHLFHGVQEQNYIAHAMAYASCVGANKAHCSAAYRISNCHHLVLLCSITILVFASEWRRLS